MNYIFIIDSQCFVHSSRTRNAYLVAKSWTRLSDLYTLYFSLNISDALYLSITYLDNFVLPLHLQVNSYFIVASTIVGWEVTSVLELQTYCLPLIL